MQEGGSRAVDQLGPNALGEVLEPGRVGECYLGLLLPPGPVGEPEAGTILILAPATLLHPAVPPPAARRSRPAASLSRWRSAQSSCWALVQAALFMATAVMVNGRACCSRHSRLLQWV
jgi:hypothetical protein